MFFGQAAFWLTLLRAEKNPQFEGAGSENIDSYKKGN
jgi:hypothetical protein